MKNKHIISYIIFIILFGLYLYETMSILSIGAIQKVSSNSSLICIGLIMFLALYFFFNIKELKSKKKISPIPILNVTLLVAFILAVFWSLTRPFGSIATYFMLIMPLFILNFSYTVVQHICQYNLIININIAFLFFLLYSYINFYNINLSFLGKDETVTSSSYILIYLLPILLCAKSKIIKVASFIGVFIAVILSAKRGGLIAMLMGLLVYLMVDNLLLKNQKHKVIKVVGFFVFLGVAIAYIQSVLASGDILIAQRLMDISDSGGSGRDKIWLKTWDMILNSDLPYYIFGHGYDQVAKDSPLHFSAHNDLLEIIYDYGIPVFILYIIFNVQLIKRTLKMIKTASSYAAPLAFTYATFFVNSMVSHIFIYPYYMAIYAYVWGSILGLYHMDFVYKKNNTIL